MNDNYMKTILSGVKEWTENLTKDWNENDPTQPGYIENRPFYTGDPVETVLVEERTVPFAELGNGLYATEFESTFAPTVGETYKVSWDGTVYECTCVDFNKNPFIGNLSIAGAGSDTGEPFVMIIKGEGTLIGTLDTSASHTFSISKFTQEVVKIDEKYLPDDVITKMNSTNPTGSGSFSLNRKADTTIGANSFAEGNETTASGHYSHAEGYATTASGEGSHAEGCSDHVYSVYITAERPTNEDIITTWKKIRNGFSVAKGNNSHVEGYNSLALGEDSHAEGCKTIASGLSSHAEGNETTASGSCSHAEGYETTASGSFSHAECNGTTASGNHSHAEGVGTTASGGGSHAEGYKTIASSNYQHVQGQYNIEDSSGTYADIVGNGNINRRSNAYTLDWEGNAWHSGTIEGKALILPSSTAGSTKKFKITVDDSGTISAAEVV